jgi:hypothetical protein
MPADLQADDALTLLQDHLRRGVRATPLCLAVMGWLSGTPTTPSITDIRRTDDGLIWLQLSDEPELSSLCSFTQFLQQVEVICISLPLDEMQTRHIVTLASQRLH